jgi:hypothetical protein
MNRDYQSVGRSDNETVLSILATSKEMNKTYKIQRIKGKISNN